MEQSPTDFVAHKSITDIDVAKIQVLVARYGDRTPRMLSANRPIEEQLEDLVREFGELHVTVNGKSYAEFADEYDLERRGDDEPPHAPGRVGPTLENPTAALERSRETGAHHADNFQGNILPVADSDPTGRLADEAREQNEKNALLQDALKKDEERKKQEQARVDNAVKSQLTRQLSEQAGESTSSGGAAPDQVENANRQEAVSDAQLGQRAADAEDRGDQAQADEIRQYLALSSEGRKARSPIVDADGKVRFLNVATGETIDVSRAPNAPRVIQSTASVATRDANQLANGPPSGAMPSVNDMDVSQLKNELNSNGEGFDQNASTDDLRKLVQEARAKRSK